MLATAKAGPDYVVLDDSSSDDGNQEDVQPRARRRGNEQQLERIEAPQQLPSANPIKLPTQDGGDDGAAASTSTCCICLDVVSIPLLHFTVPDTARPKYSTTQPTFKPAYMHVVMW
jgi:hypothetical protein